MFREQPADYICDPSTSNSRRGLKRSWQGTPVEDGEEGTSSSKSKPSSKDKGGIFNGIIVSCHQQIRKIITNAFKGKTSASSKVKNPKPSQAAKETTKTKTKIPRMSELFGEDLDEDDLGQGQEKPCSTAWKFSNTSSSKIHSLINKDLLPVKMSSLCYDLENLVLCILIF